MIRNEGEKTIATFPWIECIAERTDMITEEYYLWIKLLRNPTKSELAELRAHAARVPADVFIYTNVDAREPRNMRFAAWFGFREVRRNGNISIQVLGREKWKLH